MLVQTAKNKDVLHAILEIQLKTLKLPTFLKQYASLEKEAAKEGHGYAHYLNVLSEAELVHREENRARKRLALAVNLPTRSDTWLTKQRWKHRMGYPILCFAKN